MHISVTVCCGYLTMFLLKKLNRTNAGTIVALSFTQLSKTGPSKENANMNNPWRKPKFIPEFFCPCCVFCKDLVFPSWIIPVSIFFGRTSFRQLTIFIWGVRWSAWVWPGQKKNQCHQRDSNLHIRWFTKRKCEIPKEPIFVECERFQFTFYQYFLKLQLLSHQNGHRADQAKHLTPQIKIVTCVLL